MEKRVSELETVVNEKTVKLETYERLEQELDEVIMQAADGKYLWTVSILGVPSQFKIHWRTEEIQCTMGQDL